MVRLDLDRVRAAEGVIDARFRNTPAYAPPALAAALGCELTLKVETLNPVRSFKGRGTETITAGLEREAYGEVVCASAGNLGLALAWSGSRRELAVTVFAATTANAAKIDAMRAAGATVHLGGDDIERPRRLAHAYAQQTGAYLVEDSLDLGSGEGAATIGLELARAAEPYDVVLVALGGGALASGVGYVLHQLTPRTEVVAIQPAGAPAMALSWRAKHVVTTETVDTIADGVAGRFPIPEVLDDLLEVVDDVALVREDSIVAGMRRLFVDAGLVVEPSAALGVAAILEDRERFAGRRVATVVCGSNVRTEDLRRWVLD